MTTQNIIESFIDDSDFVGGIFDMDFDTCKIHTNEYIQKHKCGGLPKHSLLLAKMERSVIEDSGDTTEGEDAQNGISEPDTLHEHALLLRLRKPTDLPIESELTRARHRNIEERVLEEIKGEKQRRSLDSITRQELQKTAYEAEILGTFNYNDRDELEFGPGSAYSVFSSGEYTVYKPKGESLSKIVSYLSAENIDENKLIDIGEVQYASSNLRSDVNTSAALKINTDDLVGDGEGKKTAVFGMTGEGKSNILKILATAVQESQEDVGQLIFDPSGEYTPNNQDAIALSETSRDVKLLDYEALDINLLDPKNAKRVQSKARDEILKTGTVPGYANPFLDSEILTESEINNLKPNEKARPSRQLAAFQAVLIEAGLDPGSEWELDFVANKNMRETVDNESTQLDIPIESTSSTDPIEWNGDRIGFYNGDGWLKFSNKRKSCTGNAGEALVEFWKTLVKNNQQADYSEDSDSYKIAKMFGLQSNHTGTDFFTGLSNYHTPTIDETPEELAYRHLAEGKLVIVSIREGDTNIVSEQLEEMVSGITDESKRRFNNKSKNEQMPKILIYLEEAHNYLSQDEFDPNKDKPYVELAKEGRKFQLGLVYATQEVSVVDDYILSNTANWFVMHLNTKKETKILSNYYDFEEFSRGIRKIDNKKGYARVRTASGSFTVPAQIREFTSEWVYEIISSSGTSAPPEVYNIGLEADSHSDLDTDVRYEIEAPEAHKWRTDAYDTYDGVRWKRSGEAESYKEPLPFNGLTENQIEYQVTTKTETDALPAPWHPEKISGVDDILVTSEDGLRSKEKLAVDTTYSGVSNIPIKEPETLSEVERSNLEDVEGILTFDEIQEKYTQLPEDIPNRLRERTEEIIEGTETLYEAVIAVRDWLKHSKKYSLEPTTPKTNVASKFVFEMEAGMCQHFATSMVVMLRTQGIPARYVVGYSAGHKADDGHYVVRGNHAHAWTEVFFLRYGWIPFEPTASAEREAADNAGNKETDRRESNSNTEYESSTDKTDGE